THVSRTGDIGYFIITAEMGVAAGIRRIEAVTCGNAARYLDAGEQTLRHIAVPVKSGCDQSHDKVKALLERNRPLPPELEQLKAKLASSAGSDLATSAVDVQGVKVVAARLDGVDRKSLMDMVDQLKNKLGTAVVLLAAQEEDKVSVVAGVTKNLTDRLKAGDLVKSVSEIIGGKGGGRPDMAQGGGSDIAKLPTALESVQSWVETRL